MTVKAPASSLAQTWQVGPRRNNANQANVDELERTQTILAQRFRFRICKKDNHEARVLELGIGSHAFFFDAKLCIKARVEQVVASDFEINLHQGGAHFVDTSGGVLVKVNGRYCAFARLRSGDRVEGALEELVFEGPLVHASNETSVSLRAFGDESEIDLAPGPVVTSQPSAPKVISKKVVKEPLFQAWKVIVGVLVVGALGGLGASYLVMKRRPPRNSQRVVVAPALALENKVPPSVAQLPEKPPEVASSEVKPPEPVRVFGKNDLKAALDLFKKGDDDAACKRLAEALGSQSTINPWKKKAALLAERRCR